MGESVRIIEDEAEFGALRKRWNSLADCAVDSSTFLTHDWLHAWWDAYRPKARLAVVTVERSGRLFGIAPLMLMRQGAVGRVFRRLRFIGDGTSETDHMTFIVDPELRREVLQSLLVVVDRMPWDIAHFNQIPEASANTTQLLDFARDHGWLMTTAQFPCPLRTLPASYEDLLRSLPSRLRTSLRSSRRALAAQHSVDFGLVSDASELPGALEALYRNHTGRWQSRGEEGVFAGERKRAFYADLSERLLAAGRLRFFYLRLDGRVVAQQFCFEHKGTVLLLQEGFDVEFARQNVGNVLRSMVFEWLIDHQLRAYDFLAGTSRHKLAWSDSCPLDISVRACRPTPVGWAAHNLPRFLRSVRPAKQTGEAELVE
jgi:CelD/BcsL family acetyltransferase involved in cellulose biosynthesis